MALNAIFRRPGGGTVVTLGDYVDRGPESRQIISHLMTLREAPQPGWKVICLKGNHEDMMHETLAKLLQQRGAIKSPALDQQPPNDARR
jgi:metallophosphoesterase superfamily enzyme